MAGRDFTIAATVLLKSIDADANVRTIASCWNAANETPGWSLGVTGTKSKHQPRNLILQLVGQEKYAASTRSSHPVFIWNWTAPTAWL